MLQSSTHPKVSFFHLLFKLSALFFYFLGWFFISDYVAWFVPCVLSLAADFWMTKNVSGRLLVGLRWWSEIDESGQSVWKFENRADKTPTNGADSTKPIVNTNDYRIFWYSMYLSAMVWSLLAFWNLLRLHLTNLLIMSIALSLQSSNIIGYGKCYRDMETKLENNLNSFIRNSAFSALRGNLFGSSPS